MNVHERKAKLVRDMLEARRAMIAAWDAHQTAHAAYRKLEDEFINDVPIKGRQPDAVICGDLFIRAGPGWHNEESEHRLEFHQGTRVHTSD